MKRIQSVVMALFFAAGVVPAFAQPEPAIQEKVDVNLVLVDVTVTDRDGNQILGMNRDDFVVLENGRPQEIASIDYFTNRRLLTEPENEAAFQVERVKEDRYFVLFFHKLADSAAVPELRQQLLRARDAAERFIDEQMLPEDHVAVVGYDVRLKVFSDFTSDDAALKVALAEAVRFSNGLMEAPEGVSPSILANIDSRTMMNETGRIESAIELLAKAVNPIEARTVLVLFSPGVVAPESGAPRLLQYDKVRFDRMTQTLNESNVSVYSINLLQDVFYHASEDFLSQIAAQTGGEYFRATVTYDYPLQRIENENNGYYLLSYYTDRSPDQHGYQEIEVSLKNPQFRLKSREGYKY